MSIDTEDLIKILSTSMPPRRPMRLELFAFLAVLLSASVTILILGLRPELKAGAPPLSFWMKSVLLLATLLVSLRSLSIASGPVVASRKFTLEITAALLVILLLIGEWATVEPSLILKSFSTINFPCCLICVCVYGTAAFVALTLLMRKYAPADGARCASLIGFASASFAGLGYSIHCGVDSPTFIVVAYGLPMLALYAVGRRVLPRYLKW